MKTRATLADKPQRPKPLSSRLVFADESGRVFDHPFLTAVVASDSSWAPAQEWKPLPAGASLQALPGWQPVGYDPDQDRFVVLREFEVEGRLIRPRAVGAVLPPGWTRAALPAGKRSLLAPTLPQWAYTAVGYGPEGFRVAALKTERRGHWNPSHFSTPDLPDRVAAARAAQPENRVLKQLEICALRYRCFTAQNVFYGRDEGALPASTSCNARCVGCISEQPRGLPPASHDRMDAPPEASDLAEVGGRHLQRAAGRPMVSFGQGCEGEPLTRARTLIEAVRRMRRVTARGSIHINTNGSLPEALAGLARAGLDSVRISLNSANPALYEAYYAPQGYDFAEVEKTIARARRAKLYVALNLLTFPGITDRADEVEALCDLVVRHRVDQIQTRPLAIDPLTYLELSQDRALGGKSLGLAGMLRRFRGAAPWIRIGNFSRARGER